jgi:hypothetical protein
MQALGGPVSQGVVDAGCGGCQPGAMGGKATWAAGELKIKSQPRIHSDSP